MLGEKWDFLWGEGVYTRSSTCQGKVGLSAGGL